MRTPLFAVLMLVPSLAAAQEKPTETGQPPQRIRSVTIMRGQPCPSSTGDEVVVCSTIIEPYRIPAPLRELKPSAANNSWVNRAATVDALGRRSAGLPDSCSPIGAGGQSGCALSWNNAYGADRRARKAEAEAVPGGAE